MISTRNGHLIYGKVAVPVREVTEKICDRQTIEQICNRYPLTNQGVMECLDAVADLDKFDSGIHLELMDTNNNSGVLTLEARSMSDVFFLKVIQYGKVFLEKETDFNKLYDKGFRMCAIESFEDELNGSVGFESSEIHSIVHSAITEVGQDFDKREFVNFLKEEDEAQI